MFTEEPCPWRISFSPQVQFINLIFPWVKKGSPMKSRPSLTTFKDWSLRHPTCYHQLLPTHPTEAPVPRVLPTRLIPFTSSRCLLSTFTRTILSTWSMFHGLLRAGLYLFCFYISIFVFFAYLLHTHHRHRHHLPFGMPGQHLLCSFALEKYDCLKDTPPRVHTQPPSPLPEEFCHREGRDWRLWPAWKQETGRRIYPGTVCPSFFIFSYNIHFYVTCSYTHLSWESRLGKKQWTECMSKRRNE